MPKCLLWLLAGALLSGCCAPRWQQRDTLTQVSTIDALLTGVYEGPTTVGQLLRQGDFGLGTFHQLDGEMIVLDGRCYQVTSDGLAKRVPRATRTPFAAVTWFSPDREHDLPPGATLADLTAVIDGLLPTVNLFYAIRVDGEFARVKVRSVPRQTPPYRPLVEVVKEQPVYELTNVTGTLVGFRCPPYAGSLNVPGYHLHFITADRSRGGHVLDLTLTHGRVGVDETDQLRVRLPDDAGFYQAPLDKERRAELHRVEK
jgi:acetolactate decarboxylase